MAKRINITETELIKLIEHEMEDQLNLPGGYDLEDDFEDEIENEFEDDRDILTPEEIVGLMEEQIVQLQENLNKNLEL